MDKEYSPISPNPDQQCQPPHGQLNFSHRSIEFCSVKDTIDFKVNGGWTVISNYFNFKSLDGLNDTVMITDI